MNRYAIPRRVIPLRYDLADIAAASFDGLSALSEDDPISPGDIVKIVVQSRGTGEGLWAIVDSIRGTGAERSITAAVNNYTCHYRRHGLRLGSLVTFEPRHVREVMRATVH